MCIYKDVCNNKAGIHEGFDLFMYIFTWNRIARGDIIMFINIIYTCTHLYNYAYCIYMNMHILKNKCTFKNNKPNNLKIRVIHFSTRFEA